jgi:hypothetical protein
VPIETALLPREIHDLSTKIPKLSRYSQDPMSGLRDSIRITVGLKVMNVDEMPAHQVQRINPVISHEIAYRGLVKTYQCLFQITDILRKRNKIHFGSLFG